MRKCPQCDATLSDKVLVCPTHGVPTITIKDSTDPLLGTSIGAYTLKARLGEGGMGTVYLGEHQGIQRQVAIKILRPQHSADPATLERFFAEARAVNLIRHENIIDIYDLSCTEDGRAYIVMEYLEGEILSTLLKRQSILPLELTAPLLLQVCDALAAAHGKGVIHRDLKPDNIFLVHRPERPPFIKLLDFGIAKLADKDPAAGSRTQSGAILGTPLFMAPEQASGKVRDIDHRSDIYSLGVIAFRMLCGKLPFEENSLGDLLVAHLTKTPPRPRSLNPDLPEALEEVLLKALSKEREKRHQSATEFAKALRVASGLPELGSVPSLPALYLPPPQETASLADAPTTGPGSNDLGTATTLGSSSGEMEPEELPSTAQNTQERQRRKRKKKFFLGSGVVLLFIGMAIGSYYYNFSVKVEIAKDPRHAAAKSMSPLPPEPEEPAPILAHPKEATPGIEFVKCEIESDPKRANVVVQEPGRSWEEKTPHRFKVPKDTQLTFVVSLDGYKETSGALSAENEETCYVNVLLEPLPASEPASNEAEPTSEPALEPEGKTPPRPKNQTPPKPTEKKKPTNTAVDANDVFQGDSLFK